MAEEFKNNNDTGGWDLDEIRRAIEESAAKQEAADREAEARAAAERSEEPPAVEETPAEPAPRQRSPYYYLPGGRVQLGETVEEAALHKMELLIK